MELIKIEKSQSGRDVVDARELHEILESKKKFSDWITNKVVNNPIFVENEDYCLLHNLGKQNGRGGHNRKDYAITLNTAKQVALMENTKKGKEIRQYFIECEKKLKEQISIPQSFSEALQLAADQAKQLELQAPKVKYHDEVLTSVNTYTTTQIAKELGMSAVKLNKELKQLGVQFKQRGQWLLKAKYQDKGYTDTETVTFTRSGGETDSNMKTVWTEKGREFIHDLISR